VAAGLCAVAAACSGFALFACDNGGVHSSYMQHVHSRINLVCISKTVTAWLCMLVTVTSWSDILTAAPRKQLLASPGTPVSGFCMQPVESVDRRLCLRCPGMEQQLPILRDGGCCNMNLPGPTIRSSHQTQPHLTGSDTVDGVLAQQTPAQPPTGSKRPASYQPW